MELSETELENLGREKIETGRNLYEKLNSLNKIFGVTKIQRKILSELSSLQKVNQN